MRTDLKGKKKIAQELTVWLKNYDCHIVHDRIMNYLLEVRDTRAEDKLAYLLVSERITEESEKMKYTNCIFENIIKSLQEEKTIRRLRSLDLAKRSIQCRINMCMTGYPKLWLKMPVEQKDINEHNALYSLILYLNEWVQSETFLSLPLDNQKKILRKFEIEKDEIYGCVFRLDLCALNRYVDNYQAAISYLKEVFNDEQELLYANLQIWIDELKESTECKSWISCYLNSSKRLEFKDNIILTYVNNIEEAKAFLLSECKKDLESERKEFEEVLEEIDNNRTKARRKELIENILLYDYRGSYAQEEMGYSDDEIDTIFDGNPDAYWNID